MTFENSLDNNQAQLYVGPDQDPNCLTLWWYFWKKFLKILIKSFLKKKSADGKIAVKISQHAIVYLIILWIYKRRGSVVVREINS